MLRLALSSCDADPPIGGTDMLEKESRRFSFSNQKESIWAEEAVVVVAA